MGARMDAAEIVEKAKLVEARQADGKPEFDLRLNLFYEGNQLCFMSPELINRIDSVIVFQQLAKEQVHSIIDNLTRNLRAFSTTSRSGRLQNRHNRDVN